MTEERTMRVSSAESARPSVTAGRMMLDHPKRPEGASQPSQTAKMYMKSGPTTKLGRLMPTSARTERALSIQLPRFVPATTPSGTATATATSSAAIASWMVAP